MNFGRFSLFLGEDGGCHLELDVLSVYYRMGNFGENESETHEGSYPMRLEKESKKSVSP